MKFQVLVLGLLASVVVGCSSAPRKPAVVDVKPTRVPTRPASGLLDEAEAAYLKGEFRHAARHYRLYATTYPKARYTGMSWYWAGRSEKASGNRNGARSSFESATRFGGEVEVLARLEIADLSMYDGMWSVAAASYDTALEKLNTTSLSSDNIAGHFLRAGIAHCRAGNWARGQSLLTSCHLRFAGTKEADRARELLRLTEGKFFVQLGAFRDRGNALGYRSELNRKGILEVEVIETISAGRALFVLRGPRFPSYQAAVSHAGRLKQQGIDAIARP